MCSIHPTGHACAHFAYMCRNRPEPKEGLDAKLHRMYNIGMKIRSTVALLAGLVCASCTPTTAQTAAATKTAADAEALVSCVSTKWGQPVEVIALACTGNVITAATDVVADIEILLESKGAAPAYTTDSRVTERVLAKKSQ
jgi:hypothetical protein